MLLGEHAVLQNKRAMVLAVDKRIMVTLVPRKDKRVIIHASLGKLERHLDDLVIEKPFQFVCAAILALKEQFTLGFELSIVSEFSDTVGLGSSAAVTVATMAVLLQMLEKQPEPLVLLTHAKAIVAAVQGVGSGADVAASIYGGVVLYQQNPPYVLQQFAHTVPLVVVYSGAKTPTPEVIKWVESRRQHYPALYDSLFAAMDCSVGDAVPLIEQENWPKLGELFNVQHSLMNAIGVGSPILNQLTDVLNSMAGIYGAKISGSGLGDCVIGLGNAEPLQEHLHIPGAMVIPVSGSREGIRCE